jgi:hypothetical protein
MFGNILVAAQLAASQEEFSSMELVIMRDVKANDMVVSDISLEQCCTTFSYIGAYLTDGCGGAGAVWRLQ